MTENYWGHIDGNQGGLDEDYPACISCNTRDGVVEDDVTFNPKKKTNTFGCRKCCIEWKECYKFMPHEESK